MVPGLQEWQEQARGEQNVAIDQQNVGPPDPQEQRRCAADRDHRGDLHAVVGQVHQQQMQLHGFSLPSMVSTLLRLSLRASLRRSRARVASSAASAKRSCAE